MTVYLTEKFGRVGYCGIPDGGARLVTQDWASWQVGYDAGEQGKPNVCPAGLDRLSFASGYVDGRDAQLKATGK